MAIATPAADGHQRFLEASYRQILGRDLDQAGRDHYTTYLDEGHSRFSVLAQLVRSDEFLNGILKEKGPRVRLKSIKEANPSRYSALRDRTTGASLLAFTATGREDFNWLERMILENNYYEKDGVWNIVIDADKRVMAEIMAAFEPQRALELGCSNGAVMQCLHMLGVYCEGVEISRLAIERAFPQIRDRIWHGDLLELKLPGGYDLIFGLDIFEHLNPNRLDNYISTIASLLSDGGYLFGNIPAFGSDPIYGVVFPVYIESWDRDIALGRPFHTLHVDTEGYPINGHLIWADSNWWVEQFEKHGLRREVEIEGAFHAKYDAYMESGPIARKTYYVFSKNADPQRTEAIIAAIRSTPSRALGAVAL
ncbi:MAG TPA: methyltransferase domain-containing protein [Ardenticatenaceae bacterium]|nr:methyltransferase domain-containing protein [Ardenticatenaceae bacterium]